MAKRTKINYIDPDAFLAAMVAHHEAVKSHRKQKLPPPPVSDFIGECLLKIAQRLSTRPNFASYSFREEMVSDAVENCLQYIHNWDPKKGTKPFAYFTQVSWYAFVRRIEREKKHMYTKLKYAVHQAHTHQDHIMPEGATPGSVADPTWLSYENVHEFIGAFEARLQKRSAVVEDEDEASNDFETEAFEEETE